MKPDSIFYDVISIYLRHTNNKTHLPQTKLKVLVITNNNLTNQLIKYEADLS